MKATEKPMDAFEKHCSDLRVGHGTHPTIEQKIREMLTEHGLWPNERVDDVIERCKNHEKLFDSMGNRWGDRVDDYPRQILSILWLSVKIVTLEYIDEVIPLAFYRGMFE